MKRHAPAAGRNSAPIADVLAHELPASGTVLEIASGTGEHAVFMARRFPGLIWQSSDADPSALASIGAYAAEAGLNNLRAPILLDAQADAWPTETFGALVCINMVHISPWAAAEGLFRGAARLLAAGAALVLYGPYLEDNVATADSNLAFDASLRARDRAWGLRRIEEMDALAASHSFARTARHEMPANNLTLIYRK